MRYYEVPVTLIDEFGGISGPQSFYVKGEDEESVRRKVAEFLEMKYPDQSFDYDLIELSTDDSLKIPPEDFENLDNLGTTTPSPDNKKLVKNFDDEVEDLQDLYYTLYDRFNAMPAGLVNPERDNHIKELLVKARELFDQYDLGSCREVLTQVEAELEKL